MTGCESFDVFMPISDMTYFLRLACGVVRGCCAWGCFGNGALVCVGMDNKLTNYLDRIFWTSSPTQVRVFE